MEIDLATFLTALYLVVDDVYQAEFAPARPVRPGAKPSVADSEVLTLILLAQWQHNRSESAFVAYAHRHWRGYFPRLLSQSAFNRRARSLVGVLCRLGPLALRHLLPTLLVTTYEVLDGVPVALMRRCRGERHHLFGEEAGIGRGGSDREWYYGVELVASVTPTGIITGFLLSPANTEERWTVDAFLRWRDDPLAPQPTPEELAPFLGPAHRGKGQRQGPSGPLRPRAGVGQAVGEVYLGDDRLRGEAWARHWVEHYDAAVVIPQTYVASFPPPLQEAAHRHFHALGQVVETSFATLIGVFGLTFPRARTPWGLVTRIAAKIAAFDLAVYLNHLFGRPPFAIFNPLG